MHRVLFLMMALVGWPGFAFSTFAEESATWTAQDTEGTFHRLLGQADLKASVLIFLQPDCPISNQYAPTLNRLVEKFSSQGIAFFRVYPDSDLTKSDIRKHTRAFAYRCPALPDPKHLLTDKTGVSITPEVVVLLPNGDRVYQGRIDDRYVAFGKKRPAPTREDLRLVLEAILQGERIEPAQTKSIGCSIAKEKN